MGGATVLGLTGGTPNPLFEGWPTGLGFEAGNVFGEPNPLLVVGCVDEVGGGCGIPLGCIEGNPVSKTLPPDDGFALGVT